VALSEQKVASMRTRMSSNRAATQFAAPDDTRSSKIASMFKATQYNKQRVGNLMSMLKDKNATLTETFA
jgi:hypothetical protein